MVEWSGHAHWIDGHATRGLWVVPPETSTSEFAGYVKESSSQGHLLTFLVVYNSGHLVPHNQPKVSTDLLTRFITNTTFVDRTIPNYFARTNSGDDDGDGSTTDTVDDDDYDDICFGSTLLAPKQDEEQSPGSNGTTTLQWSIIGTLVGLVIGIVLGSSFVNTRRIKNILYFYKQQRRRQDYQAIPSVETTAHVNGTANGH